MKRFFQVAAAVKEAVCLCYTAAMCFYLFFLWMFRRESADLSVLFSLLLVCAAAGTLQILAFSGLLIKKLAYGWRMLVFFIPFFAVLAAFAVGGGWFPVESAGAWAAFVVIFLVISVLITAGIELYYRLSGRKYDDRLDWYRRNREKE